MAVYSITRKLGVTALAICAALSASSAYATIVQFQTTLGDFEVNLYDDLTPQTVENFLLYVEAGAYQNNVVHRSVANFVIQGGGFTLEENALARVETPWSPNNEPVFANVRGTIAMAKIGGDPHSATSQWFINLKDNTQSLDHENGGYTVFGQVVGDGMDVVNAIAALNSYNLTGVLSGSLRTAFTHTPLIDEPASAAELTQGMADYLVVTENIVVIDAEANTAEDLDRPLLTPPPKKRKKKGGAIGLEWLAFGALFASLAISRRRRSISR